MITIHHKPLKMFNIDGMIHSDSIIMRIRDEYINLIKSNMNILGYVPRLDIDPDFTVEYNRDKDYFEFELSMYGIFVGKKKVKWILGVDGTVVVPILSSRSNEFSSEVV
jgi:hypothetical protein